MSNGPARAPDLGSTKRTKEDFSRMASSRIGPFGVDASFALALETDDGGAA